MGAVVSNWCRHGMRIEDYISSIHPKKALWDEYRKSWDDILNGRLRFVLLETVSRCNMKCIMCVHSTHYAEVSDMSSEIFESVSFNIEKYAIPSVCMNQTNEPLLDKKIVDRIQQISSIPTVVDVMMNTNALLLDLEISEKIINSGLHKLMIGFDAYTSQTFNKIRTGSFEKIKKNILAFLRLRNEMGKNFPVVRLSFVRTSYNAHEVDEWVNYWKDLADYVTVQEFITPVTDGSRDFLFASDSYRNKELLKQSPVCDQPFRQVSIRGNGDVIACCSHMAISSPIGNILAEKDLLKIFQGNIAEKLRSTLLDDSYKSNPVCSVCMGSI